MSETDVTNSVITALETMVHDAGTTLTTVGTKYGPEIVDTACSYIRTLAIINSIQSIIGIIISGICFTIVYRYVPTEKNIEKRQLDYDICPLYIVLSILCFFAGLMIFTASMVSLFSTDNILGIFSPKLEMIKMAKDSITGHVTHGGK